MPPWTPRQELIWVGLLMFVCVATGLVLGAGMTWMVLR